ncbi:MAG: DUF4920 domain-containing protein [Flavobacteriales bacterium]
MKKIIGLSVIAIAFLYSCGNGKAEGNKEEEETKSSEDTTAKSAQTFGEEITEEGALPVAVVGESLENADSVQIKLTGTIDAVCKVKGCWMTMKVNEDVTMRVKFKDYAFFVPKDASGRTAVVDGWAYKEIVSVEDQKHLAEDNGDSKEEIAKITDPKMEYSFMAHGVIIK